MDADALLLSDASYAQRHLWTLKVRQTFALQMFTPAHLDVATTRIVRAC